MLVSPRHVARVQPREALHDARGNAEQEEQRHGRHDGERQPEQQRVLDVAEHVHQRGVRAARHVLGRLEAGAHQVDAAECDERGRRRGTGHVAPPPLVWLDVHVVQQDDEADEEHQQEADERVVDEGEEEDEDEPAPDQHARPAHAVRVVLEGSLQDVEHRLFGCAERAARGRVGGGPPHAAHQPEEQHRQRAQRREEELREGDTAGLQQGRPDEQDDEEGRDDHHGVHDNAVLPVLVAGNGAVDE